MVGNIMCHKYHHQQEKFQVNCPQRTCDTYGGRGHCAGSCPTLTAVLATVGAGQYMATHALTGCLARRESIMLANMKPRGAPVAVGQQEKYSWVADSCTTSDMTPSDEYMASYVKCDNKVTTASDDTFAIEGYGAVIFSNVA